MNTDANKDNMVTGGAGGEGPKANTRDQDIKINSKTINTQEIRQDFIVGNVDSKTKGYERFADCYELANGPLRVQLSASLMRNKIFRI